MGKLKSTYKIASALGVATVLVLKVITLAVGLRLRLRYKSWRYKARFKAVIKKGGLPEDLREYLIKEYEEYLRRASEALKVSNLIRYFTSIRSR